MGSHDHRIFCRRPLSRWIPVSQGLDLPADRGARSGPRSPHAIPHFAFQAHMLLAHQCRDTCSVLSSHGIPGLLGWLAHLLLQMRDSEDRTT